MTLHCRNWAVFIKLQLYLITGNFNGTELRNYPAPCYRANIRHQYRWNVLTRDISVLGKILWYNYFRSCYYAWKEEEAWAQAGRLLFMMDEFTSSHGDISSEVASGERSSVKSYGAYSPSRRIFWLSFALSSGCALSRLNFPPSHETDYIDRFMEPVLLHDPAGTCKTSIFDPSIKYTPAKRTTLNVRTSF